MLNIALREDTKDRFPVRRVVHVGTGEQLVDDVLNLLVVEQLSIGDSSMAGQTHRQLGIE